MIIKLIYRKPKPEFNSIENVFDTLLPCLSVEKIELPFFSKGFMPRKKNIQFVKSLKAKLIHVTGYDHYLLLGLKKKKTILTIHDIEILKRNKGLKRFILKKIWFDIPIKYAHTVTTISDFSKKEILTLNDYKTPIVVIYNPITLPIKYKAKIFNTEEPIILHIGTKENKNLNRLIIALYGIKCKLIIIGKPNQSQINLLKKSNIKYTIKTNLNNDQMVNEYEKCDILSFVSTYEGFGLPIIEAQTCGRVVITSNISSLPEVAGNGAYFINPYDITEIKNGIKELINNSKLRDELIQNGIENVKRFNPEQIANQYKELYQKVLNEI